MAKPTLVSVAPVLNAIVQVEAISVAHTDITERKNLEAQLALANEQLHRLSRQDHLTHLYNRRHFDDILQAHTETFFDKPLSAIMIDIDYFKQFNDYYGHPAGDDCLKFVAECISSNIDPASAIPCRYGGEEFSVLFPSMERHAALSTAENIRKAIEAKDYTHLQSPFGRVTVSIGLAALSSSAQESERPHCGHNLIAAADRALYMAKASGKNQVCVAPVP